jgi:hypothetical protein
VKGLTGLGAVLLGATTALAAVPARANDFPTTARVEFVLGCMKGTKHPLQEMVYKCSCAIDHIASKVDYDAWVELATVANAITMAGERGGEIRDMKDGRKIAAQYRDLQAQARHACFIDD